MMRLDHARRSLRLCIPYNTRRVFSLGHQLSFQASTADFGRVLRDYKWLAPRRPGIIHGVRGKKTKATLSIDELPQGSIASAVVENELLQGDSSNDVATYPPVLQQAYDNIRNLEPCVILTRVGNFYELYFHQAKEYGPLLGIKVSTKKTALGAVPMAGFPYWALETHLRKLVEDNDCKVVMVEEFEKSAEEKSHSDGLMFNRKIHRIVTPGTLIDERFLDPLSDNFLLGIHPTESDSDFKQFSLAWLDLSSSKFFVQACSRADLASNIARVAPREVIIDRKMKEQLPPAVADVLAERATVTTYVDGDLALQNSAESFEQSLDTTPIFEFAAARLVWSYAKQQFHTVDIKLPSPVKVEPQQHMIIDRHTMRALELRKTWLEGNFKGSLLHAIRRTVTRSGTRLLTERLLWPSADLRVIDERLDLVEAFQYLPVLRSDVTESLKSAADVSRLLSKFTLGRGDADDLLLIAKSTMQAEKIRDLLQQSLTLTPRSQTSPPKGVHCLDALSEFIKRFDLASPKHLSQLIHDAVDESGLEAIHDREAQEQAAFVDFAKAKNGQMNMDAVAKGSPALAIQRDREDRSERGEWVMRRTASRSLKRLHASLDRLIEDKEKLAEELRTKFQAESLTLRWTASLGHFCHVKGKDAKTSHIGLKEAKTLGSTKSTRSLHVEQWTQLGHSIDSAKTQIRREEQVVFNTLRREVVENVSSLRTNGSLLDELDIATSFSLLAEEQNWVRPILNTGTSLQIIGGRHPTVTRGLSEQGRMFTANNCILNNRKRIWFITGPNMAGKSTFLRQNALISILAQMGCFVPAQYAELGLVDRMFSRVGSADNVSQDQSTFMVEMLECAAILKSATDRSFVIMDEVGRGTTPEDGTALGYACLWHLFYRNRCRALFATHFHSLAQLTQDFGEIAYYCTDIMEDEQGKFSYVHALREGVNRESHALKVARIAGLPNEAIEVATSMLSHLRGPERQPLQQDDPKAEALIQRFSAL